MASSSQTFVETPYDPWGEVGPMGSQQGPRHGSPADDCDTCATMDMCLVDEWFDPACPSGDPESHCYDPALAPTSASGASGGRRMPAGSRGGLRDTTPTRPAQVTIPSSLGGEAARVREGIGQLYMVERDLVRNTAEASPWAASPNTHIAHGIGDTGSFPWGQTRGYANIEGPDAGGVNGNRWLNRELGYLDFQGAAAGVGDPERIVRRGLANEALWFEKDAQSGEYAPLTAFYGQLVHEGDTFVYGSEGGEQWVYFDNSLGHPAELRGKLKEVRSSYGGAAAAEYDANDELERITFSMWQEVSGEQVEDAFVYEYYDDINHVGMLKSVTYLYNGYNYRKVFYEYYTGAAGKGGDNDLMRATVMVWLNSAEMDATDPGFDDRESEWYILHENFYRYYTSAASPGFEHGLKMVLRAQACERIREAGLDPESVSDEVLKEYSDYYFEYDGERRVAKQAIRGGAEEFVYDYEPNTDDPGIGATNTWGVRTTVTNPDGTERRTYTNPTSGVLVVCFEDAAANETYDAVERNGAGFSTRHAFPTAISSVTEPSGASTELTVNYRANSGLIYEFDYYASDNPSQGEVKGRPRSTSVREGSEGTADTLDLRTWSTRTAGSTSVYPVWKHIRYPEAGAVSPPTVEYVNTFYEDGEGNATLQIEEQVAKLPVVPAGQNGDGQQHETVTRFDKAGNRTWFKDARGYITRWQYRSDGVLARRTDDVDTARAENVPAGWTTPDGGGLNLVTDLESDAEGRPLRVYHPRHRAVLGENAAEARSVRMVEFTVHRPELDETLTAVGYATGSAPAYAFETVGEVTIARTDKSGRTTEVIAARRECSCGALRADEEYPRKSWESWTRNFYDDYGLLLARRVYHRIPAVGEGERGEHYGETKYAYDEMAREVRRVGPGGTITRTVRDSRGLVTERWTGTDDSGASAADPGGGGAAGNDMVQTAALVYDDGDFNGNGLLTRETRIVDGADLDQVSEYTYDYRTLMVEAKRVAGSGGTDLISRHTYDNFGQPTRTDEYHTSVAAGNLTGRTASAYDNQGRVYRSETYAVAPDGTVGNALAAETWRDANGNPVKQTRQGSEAFTKTVHDGLGRVVGDYFAYNAGTSSDDNDVSADVVVEQTETVYNALDQVLLRTGYQRFHDATGNGALGGPNGDQPRARRTYRANWFDGILRTVASADYGTNAGAELERPSTVPDRSDTVLVTGYRYATDGEADAVVDPMGVETRWEQDALGRRTLLVENYDPDEPAQNYGANRTTGFRYNLDGQLATLTLVNAATGDQVTRFVYGTTAADSGVASRELLRAKIYPESGDDHDPLGDGPGGEYNRIEYEYNRQGAMTKMTDPNGTVHEYDYDKLGRRIHDRVTTVAAGVDDGVLRITTAYDNRGQVASVSSYDDASTGSGTIINQVAYEYGDFGQLSKDKQSHSGAVDGSTPEVAYAYEDASSGNTVRRTSMTYPDGRIVDYGYGASGSADDLMGRVNSIAIDGEAQDAAQYTYLGFGSVVKAAHPEPGINMSLLKTASAPTGDGGDPYAGYDRFGRIVDMRWVTSSGGAVRDRFQYGYDRGSRRTWKANLAATAGDAQDEAYSYDGLNQVTRAARGDLTINRTDVGGIPASEETFAYDPTGNWDRYVEKSDGTTDLDQPRTNNKDNQITQFDGSSEGVEHDKAGNATGMRPDASGDWSGHLQLAWDGWNRLVEVKDDGGSTIATYAYDGTGRRIASSASGITTHTYYDDRWKAVEERVDASTDAGRQYVWGSGSRNQLILRDRDTDGNGTLDERFYATWDAMHSGTSIVDTSGVVQERYGYSAFGRRRVMNADFTAKASSGYDWRLAFHGEFLDTETGLVNYGFRYYSPEIGRWLNLDPIEEEGGVNLYGFVGNNGISFGDFFGLLVEMTLNRDDGSISIRDLDTNDEHDCVPQCCISGQAGVDDDTQFGGPIPRGQWAIMNDPTDGWWALYFLGDDRFDDIHGPTGRDGFRLHEGLGSNGCITVTDSDCWREISRILRNTQHEFIYIDDLGGNVRHFGNLTVQ